MTPIDHYATTTSKALATEPAHKMECQVVDMTVPCDCGFFPSTLEQRIAVGLVTARALEGRHWADVLLREHRDNPFAIALARHLARRSHKLEKLGLEYCKEYPPADDRLGEPEPPRVTLQ